MDEFKEKIINDIVESKKIHAILKILVDYNPDLFVINGSDIKDEIFEIIGRRNIHVHKKGIVDEGLYFNKCYEMLHLFIDNWT